MLNYLNIGILNLRGFFCGLFGDNVTPRAHHSASHSTARTTPQNTAWNTVQSTSPTPRGRRSTIALLACLIATVMTQLSVSLPANASDDSDRLKVLTSFTILADMAQNVAGDAADVVSLTRPGSEIHGYQPTPKDIAKAKDAGLVLYNGMNLELWFERFLRRLNNVPAAVITDGIEPMSISEGSYEGKPNPHAWMSPSNAMIYVDNIAKAMSKVDPDNAATYRTNAAQYKESINALIDPIREKMDALPEERKWLVTSEGAFSYLIRDFGLKELYLWPMNADSQGTPQQVRRVIDTVNEENIVAVFSESTVSPKPAQQIARETSANYGGVLYVDSLSEADGPVPTYLDLIRVTTETVLQALSQDH